MQHRPPRANGTPCRPDGHLEQLDERGNGRDAGEEANRHAALEVGQAAVETRCLFPKTDPEFSIDRVETSIEPRFDRVAASIELGLDRVASRIEFGLDPVAASFDSRMSKRASVRTSRANRSCFVARESVMAAASAWACPSLLLREPSFAQPTGVLKGVQRDGHRGGRPCAHLASDGSRDKIA